LEDLTTMTAANRIQYAQQVMFKYSQSTDWQWVGQNDTSLLWRFYPRHDTPPTYASSTAAKLQPKTARAGSKSSTVPAPGQLPTQRVPLGYCRSRITKSASPCSRGSDCKFSHICPYCAGDQDHPTSACTSSRAPA
jgi:hypothetical protein